MSGHRDASRAIQARLQNGFTALPWHFEAVPMDGRQNAGGYVAATIREPSATQSSIQNTAPGLRYIGAIFVQIFTQPDAGNDAHLGYADTLAALLTRARFSHGQSGAITTGVASVVPLGEREGWLQTNVEVNYRRDVT